MKRFIFSVLFIVGCAGVITGCKSKEEQELEHAKQVASELDQEVQNATERRDQLEEDLQRYNDAVDRLNNAN